MNEVPSPESGSQRLEPHFFAPEAPVEAPIAPVAPIAPEADETPENFVYLADLPDAQAVALDPALAAAAALLAHDRAQTPISIGILGGPGSGKTSALDFVVAAAAEYAGQGRLVPVRIDASDHAEPETLIAAGVYDALTAPSADGRLASLAREAAASLRDVHAVARETADRLAEMRQNLEVERRNLESVAGRRARLAETVLFETPGSRVDSFARAHRAKIETRLRSFGYEGDLIATWKELVREMAERNPLEKFGACAQTLWAYRGQGRLLVLAVLLALLAWGFGEAEATRAAWVGWMKGGGGGASSLATWLDVHASLFGTLESLAIVLAVLCLAADAVRAARFLNPIFRGAFFLKGDLDARRRDLDALLAHQTRRVDLVTREVEAQARRAEDAERRAEGPRAAISRSEELRAFFGDDDKSSSARARYAREFLQSLERVLTRDGAASPRLLVALDGFEALSAEDASSFMQTAGRLLARRGFAAVYAVDADRIARALGADAHVHLARAFQIPLRLDRDREGAPETVFAGFDEPLSANELALLNALARFAGPQPRDAKRFANVYRLARAAGAASDGSTAGALALAVLSAMGAFEADPSARDEAAQTAAQAGFPATPDALARVEPLAARFRAQAS